MLWPRGILGQKCRLLPAISQNFILQLEPTRSNKGVHRPCLTLTARLIESSKPKLKKRLACDERQIVNKFEKGLSTMAGSSVQSSAGQMIDFLHLTQKLKVTKREGWVRMGVKGPESIADHMYRMSLMALCAPRDMGVDIDRCIKLAIAHDIAEAIVGDITPCCGVSKEEKNRLETAAIHEIRDCLGTDTIAGSHVQELWQEYEDAQTPEAQLVKDFDKIEMILQAHEYESQQPDLRLQEFFDSTKGKFKTELGKSWAEEIVRRRDQRQSTKVSQ